MEKLKISRIGGLMFIDIELWSVKENKYRNMAILFDTGASVTTISDFILTGIGCTKTCDSIAVTTASGMIKVHAKTVPKIRLGSLEIQDVQVYAHNFPDECFSDGVLGMNILDNFNFSINLVEL